MIALTWVLDLPLDYPAARTRSHAARLGTALHETDGLLAGLVGVAEAGVEGAAHNRLALASVWANSSRMAQFLWGDAMAGVERELARPSANVWPVTSVQLDRERLAKATHLGLTFSPAEDSATASRVVEHRGEVDRAVAGRSTALALRAFDVSTWSELTLGAWTGQPRTAVGSVFRVVDVAFAATTH